MSAEAFSRREFLLQAGLGALAAGSSWSVGQAEAAAPSADNTPAAGKSAGPDWEMVRSQFLLEREHVHLALLLFATHSRPVREAIERHRRGFDENPVDYLHAHEEKAEREVRAQGALHLGAKPGEIALTDSTTQGLGLLYGGIRLEKGQEILTTEHDHYSTHESLRLRAVRTGARFRKIRLYREPSVATSAEITGNLRRGIRPNTRVLAVTWVHSSTGVKLPIAEMAAVVREVNRRRKVADRVLLCVDGVHGFGVENETMESLGCDFFVAGCHKWLFGPRGTGLIWGRSEAAERLDGTIPTFSFSNTWGASRTPGGFHSFEHRWALAEAFAFHREIGKGAIQDRIHGHARRLKDGLKAISGVRLHTPVEDKLSAGIVCFELEGKSPKEVVEGLRRSRIIASVTPYAVSYARFTPGILNTAEDIDRAVAAVRTLAAAGA